MIQKYNLLSGEFDQRRDDYQQKHPDMYPQGSGTARDSRMDWQQEVKMDRSMKLVVDMQVALQKDIRSVVEDWRAAYAAMLFPLYT